MVCLLRNLSQPKYNHVIFLVPFFEVIPYEITEHCTRRYARSLFSERKPPISGIWKSYKLAMHFFNLRVVRKDFEYISKQVKQR